MKGMDHRPPVEPRPGGTTTGNRHTKEDRIMRHTSFGRDSLRATEGWLSVRRLTHSLAPVGHRFRLLLLIVPALALTCPPPSAAQRTSVSHLLRGRSVQNSR